MLFPCNNYAYKFRPIITLCSLINGDLHPDKHKSRTPYVHLFMFLQHGSVTPFSHHQAKAHVKN